MKQLLLKIATLVGIVILLAVCMSCESTEHQDNINDYKGCVVLSIDTYVGGSAMRCKYVIRTDLGEIKSVDLPYEENRIYYAY